MIVSHEVFLWFCSALVIGLSAAWIVVDIVRLRRALRDGAAGVDVHDRVFGSIVGMVIGVVGLVGAARFHLLG
jgi:hypothetical protein